MSAKEKDLVARLLKQSILTLCKETVSYNSSLEIDGIVCISLENDAQQIVIKVHEQFQKLDPFQGRNSDLKKGGDPAIPDVHYKPSRSWESGFGSQVSSETLPDEDLMEDELLSLSSGDDELDTIDEEESEHAEVNGQVSNAESIAQSNEPSLNGSTVESYSLVRRLKPPERRCHSMGSYSSSVQRPNTQRSLSYVPQRCNSAVQAGLLTKKVPVESNSVTSTDRKIACKRCDECLPSVAAFEKHNLLIHSTFTCNICCNTFTCRNNMKRHMRLHTGFKPYKCPKCPESFSRKDDVKRHILRHNFDKPYRCNLCGKGYMDRTCIRTHMRREHFSKLLHVCPQCGEGFSDSRSFQQHKKSHPELKHFRCDHCDFTGTSSLMYHKHLITHDASRTYSCRTCSESFTDPFIYTAHLKRHKLDSSFDSYICCFCGTVLAKYEQFVRHEHSHVQGKVHTCSVCQKGFKWKSNLKQHMVIHNTSSQDQQKDGEDDDNMQYWCTECQQGFGSEDQLQDHITMAHENNQVDVNTLQSSVKQISNKDLGISPKEQISSLDGIPNLAAFKDTVSSSENDSVNKECYRGWHRPQTGNVEDEPSENVVVNGGATVEEPDALHDIKNSPSSASVDDTFNNVKQEALSDVEMDSYNDDPAMEKNSDEFDTPGSSGKGKLAEEMEQLCTESTETAMSIYTSQILGNERRGKNSMKINLKVRSPGFERVITPEVLFRSKGPFTCEVCEETFTDFDSFDTHGSNIHRRFICEYCGKVFTAKPNRERHIRYHTGERPYKCQICGQSFFRGDDLKYHRTTRHSNVKPFVCSLCGMSFAWPKDLDRHMRTYAHHDD
ncbi:hypothetical protein CHS0354_039918 [Potamilus streckersoni]|uniref:C2H2-type domain-containing protein n=1 Tax=Potamilus streckersoni TaxID=2493646 RepID=A0AAE0WCD7_9BIVA|nr:hypothetical protein CHS0354_039918 [Potamilus streckersoni]